eukprot:PhM_4_TR14196/c1_g4_i4/m.27965
MLERAVSPQSLAAAGATRANMLFLINPHNPSGRCHTREELQLCVDFCRARKMHLVVDEVYGNSVFASKPGSFVSIMEVLQGDLRDDVHVLWGFSKDFCLGGFRVGMLYTHHARFRQALGTLNCFSMCSTDTQMSLAAVMADDKWMDEYHATNRALLEKEFNGLAAYLDELHIPYLRSTTGGMFLWVDFSQFLTAQTFEAEDALFERMFAEARVLLTPGKTCKTQMPGRFRICYGALQPGASVAAIKALLSKGIIHSLA